MNESAAIKEESQNQNDKKDDESVVDEKESEENELDDFPTIIFYNLDDEKIEWAIPFASIPIDLSNNEQVTYLNLGKEGSRKASIDTVKWKAKQM